MLDMIEMLATDESLPGLVLLGACRGDEVSMDSDLAKMLRRFDAENKCEIVEVQVSNLDNTSTIQLLEEAQGWPSDICEQLAIVIQFKTHGNALATKQVSELFRSQSTKSDSPKTLQARISRLLESLKLLESNGAFLESTLAMRLAELPNTVKEVLRTCACLGTTCRKSVLKLAQAEAEIAIERAIELRLLNDGPRVGCVCPR